VLPPSLRKTFRPVRPSKRPELGAFAVDGDEECRKLDDSASRSALATIRFNRYTDLGPWPIDLARMTRKESNSRKTFVPSDTTSDGPAFTSTFEA
jgi:hypothetical protein